MGPDESLPRLYTLRDVAFMMGLSRRSVERLVSSGELRSVKIGHARRIVPTHFADFVFRGINDWHDIFGSASAPTIEDVLDRLRERAEGTSSP